MKTAVIGAANVDITATPYQKYIPRDSNIGKISFSLGGVGRNIAHNLTLLGMEVSFLTAIGGDLHAREIIESCSSVGISLSHARYCPDMPSPMYLCVNDEGGDLVAGVNDMEICRMISCEYIESNLGFLNSCDSVVFDTNLDEDTIEYIMKNCSSPLFADTVSVTKAGKLGNVLKKGSVNMYSLKANRIEAAALCGYGLDTEDDIRRCAEYLLSRGVENVNITLGADGVFTADRSASFFLPCPPTGIRNATGSGDAFLSALVLARELGFGLEDAAKLGQAAAKITLESDTAVSSSLNRQTLLETFKNI